MSAADVPDVPTYDIPSRLQGKDGRPKPHIDASLYSKDHKQSIEDPTEFFGKVSV